MFSRHQLEAALNSAQLIERLAAVEHERWAHWQQYVHDQSMRAQDGSLVISPELVQRWDDQIATPYSELSETEKESDREQVRRYLPIVTEVVLGETGEE
jgi:hypothetical protein